MMYLIDKKKIRKERKRKKKLEGELIVAKKWIEELEKTGCKLIHSVDQKGKEMEKKNDMVLLIRI